MDIGRNDGFCIYIYTYKIHLEKINIQGFTSKKTTDPRLASNGSTNISPSAQQTTHVLGIPRFVDSCEEIPRGIAVLLF